MRIVNIQTMRCTVSRVQYQQRDDYGLEEAGNAQKLACQVHVLEVAVLTKNVADVEVGEAQLLTIAALVLVRLAQHGEGDGVGATRVVLEKHARQQLTFVIVLLEIDAEGCER